LTAAVSGYWAGGFCSTIWPAAFITPVLVAYFGLTGGMAVVGMLVTRFAAFPVSIDFLRLLCGGSFMVAASMLRELSTVFCPPS